MRALDLFTRGAIGGLVVVGSATAFAPAVVAVPVQTGVVVNDAAPVAKHHNPFSPLNETTSRPETSSGAATAPDATVTPVEDSGPGLASTGFDASATATLGLLSFAVGLGLVRLSRRRVAGPAR